MIRWLLIICASIALISCGVKGKLYLPGQEPSGKKVQADESLQESKNQQEEKSQNNVPVTQ